MLKKTSVVVILAVFCLVNVSSVNCFSQSANIQITNPTNDSKVGIKYLVRGKIFNYSGGNVYALVHPVETDLWWVQRPPSVINKDGTWQTLCYFGTESQGMNQYYEVIAIITNKTLKEGQTIKIKKLPGDATKSPLITVERTK